MALLCIKIFFGRILDVSLATIRMVLTVKEKHFLSALCGFIEIALWFYIVREALSSSQSSVFIAISYAGGFALGTYLGGKISSFFINGFAEIHAIISKNLNETTEKLRQNGFGVSVIDVNSSVYSGKKYLLIIAVTLKDIKKVRDIIFSENKDAFIIVDESKHIHGGFFKKK